MTEDYTAAQNAHSEATLKLSELERTHSSHVEAEASSRSTLVAEHEAKVKE